MNDENFMRIKYELSLFSAANVIIIICLLFCVNVLLVTVHALRKQQRIFQFRKFLSVDSNFFYRLYYSTSEKK